MRVGTDTPGLRGVYQHTFHVFKQKFRPKYAEIALIFKKIKQTNCKSHCMGTDCWKYCLQTPALSISHLLLLPSKRAILDFRDNMFKIVEREQNFNSKYSAFELIFHYNLYNFGWCSTKIFLTPAAGTLAMLVPISDIKKWGV